jgi:hypothetical protein
MFQRKEKLFLILVSFLLLLFICFSYAFALEIKYPSMGGQGLSEKPSFPEYVKYIFNFSIIIAGVIAFGVLVFSGIKILTSPDQPETIKDARTKITGAFLGIVILLSSYLLLTTINPQLSMLSLEPTKPTHGVYLINAEGEKDYVPQSTPKITFDANSLEFLSPKNELTSVFAYSGENYTGSWQPVNNTIEKVGQINGTDISFTIRSIYFVWNRPGIYLYPEANLGGRPLYTISSISDLSSQNFDNKTQSIEFKNKKEENLVYGTVLFTDANYKGTCGFNWTENINDLSNPGGNYRSTKKPIGNNTLSSFTIFTMEWEPKLGVAPTGRVTVYDNVNCQGNKKTYSIYDLTYVPNLSADPLGTYFETPDGSATTKEPLYENIVSFEIIGNFALVLNTEPDLGGKCQLFFKPSGNCYPTLSGTYVYNSIPPTPLWRTERVRSLLIIPVSQ